MALYLGFAVLASVLMALGLVMMKSRAASLPEARGWKVLSAIAAWLRDPVWLGGLGLQTGGYALYVIALSGAPISMAAVMMQGGIALFVVFSVVFLHERAHAREWAGIAAIVLGAILLSVSLSAGAPQAAMDWPTLVALSVICAALAAAPSMAKRLSQNGSAGAIASGLAIGLGALYTKAMAETFLAAAGASLILRVLGNPWVYGVIAANIYGAVMLQNSFARARGIMVIPLSSALSNVVSIVGGMIAFAEHLPSAPDAAAMRVGAFVLTVAASVMLAVAPAPELKRPAAAAVSARH
jgi:uncharacterized membrane protein